MDAQTARETLHGWIDDADDATAISLAELLASLSARGLLSLAGPQPDRVAVPFTMQVDEEPATPRNYVLDARANEERQERADQLAREAMLRRMNRPRPPLPPADDEPSPRRYRVRYVNSQGQETDRLGKALPPQESDDA